MIIATFRCMSVSQSYDSTNAAGGYIHTAELSPEPNDPKNQEIYKYTPLGSIRLMAIKESAGDVFKPGDLYEVTFKPAA